MTVLRAVTLDWWHTLADEPAANADRLREERITAAGAILRQAGEPVDPHRLERAFDEQLVRLQGAWAGLVDLTSEEQVLLFLDLVGVKNDALVGRLKEAFGQARLHYEPQVDPDAREVLLDLRARGLRVGLISNTGRSWGTVLRTVMAKHGLLELFDVLTFSDEARVRKPAAAIFERTLAGLGVPAAEALHVGDDPQADAAGCLAVGMKAAWLRRGPVAREAKGSPADLWIDSLPELLDQLDGL